MRRTLLIGAAGTAVLLLTTGCTTDRNSKSAGPAIAPSAAASTAAGSSAAGSSAGAQPALLSARSLVKTAALTVRVTDVDNRADQAIHIASSAGGDVLADRRDGSGTRATAELTLQVPPASLEVSLDRLAAMGDQVDRKTSTDDVTQKVVDVTSRLASMRASLDRVRALYAKANSISDVIKIESELASREADLESLEAQQHDLARQTAHATITLQLLAKQAVAPARKNHESGFVLGWHAFTTFVRGTVTVFGAMLPFLVVAAAAGALVLWWRRRAAPGSPPA